MKKNAGTSLGALALLAVVTHVITGPSERQPAGSPASAAAAPALNKADNAQTEKIAPAQSIEGPWMASRAFTYRGAAGPVCLAGGANGETCEELNLADPGQVEQCAANQACREELKRHFGLEAEHPHFLIATIPDPRHTRLALFTDSALEAIGKAAYNAGWEFARQWLPWNDAADPSEKDPENRRKQRRLIRTQESVPGLLIYRRGVAAPPYVRPNLELDLFVFVVGETPTAGLNASQFRMARAYMRAFGDLQDIRIVGPTFSGSLDSLARLVLRDRQLLQPHQSLGEAQHQYPYRVVTGTATNYQQAMSFKATTQAEFLSTGPNDVDQFNQFREVREVLHIPKAETAVLVEDESSFSRAYKDWRTGRDPIKVLQFPREISHLRNIYRDVTANISAQGSSPQEINFSLKDPDSGEDSVPVFSDTQTPLSQNAELGEIIGEVKRDRIRLLQVTATNVLDSLFLAQVLRRRCPDTRLLIPTSDLLFIEAAQTESLAGTLALSPYPLFFAAHDWLGRQAISASTDAQGIYNAVQLLLPPNDLHNSLNDYAWDKHKHPPSWLMTLGRHGFAPVALLPNEAKNWYAEVSDPASASFRLPQPPLAWVLVFTLLSLASLLLCWWIIHLKLHPRVLAWAMAAPEGRHIADAYRLAFLVGILLTLAAMQGILVIPYATGPLVVALAISVPAGVSIWLLLKMLSRPRRSAARIVYAFLLFVAPGILLIVWNFCCSREHLSTGFFFRFRTVELQPGSSPAGPILFLLLGLLVFFCAHLIRFHFLVDERPRMFTAGLDAYFRSGLRNCRRDMNRVLAAPMNLPGKTQVKFLALIVAGVMVFGLISRLDAKLSTPEGSAYNWLLLLLVVVLGLAIIITTIQATLSWAALRSLLTRLHLLPLAGAFTAVRDAGSTGPIWAKRFHLQSLDIPVRSATVLHDLELLIETDPTYKNLRPPEVHKWLKQYLSSLTRLVGEQPPRERVSRRGNPKRPQQRMNRSELRHEFSRLRFRSAMISHNLTQKVLLQEWPRQAQSWNSPLVAAEAKAANQDKYDLAQGFVALQYSMFIEYGMHQIQNLIFAISLGFGLLVIALSVYSFEAPREIGRFVLLSFVVLGYFLWRMMSQMERDPILSRLSGTTEGELNKEFYLKLIGYGALPVLGVLSSLFPAVGAFLSSWVEPSLQAFK